MRILSVQPACPTSLEDRIASALTLCDVLEVVRPLAYHADCLVSLQRCRESGTEVAVKSYPKMKLSKLAREQVDNEAYIHGSLIHDHIVPLLLAAEDERNIHLVVQWADGGDLREHMLGIGEQRLKEFVVQPLLSALAVLDSQGVVHRDLKPDNVLVHKGSVRLSDFGLAVYHGSEHQGTGHEASSNPSFDGSMTMCASMTDTVLSCASSMPVSCRSSFSALDAMHDGTHHHHAHSSTSVSDEQMHEHQRASRHRSLPCLLMRRPASSVQIMSNVGGTPMYTAPEVLRAMFQSQPISDFVSPKNDIWALGIMILEALTGCHPYSSGSTCVTGSMYSCNLLYAVAHHKGFKYPAHLSAGAVDFLKAALHVDPAQRPSAMELMSHPWLQPASSSSPQNPVSACKSPQGALSVRITADGGPVGASPRGSAGGARGCTTPVSCKASLGAALRAVELAPRISSGCFEY